MSPSSTAATCSAPSPACRGSSRPGTPSRAPASRGVFGEAGAPRRLRRRGPPASSSAAWAARPSAPIWCSPACRSCRSRPPSCAGYALPAWVGPDTLVVAISYSGDTEETLACADGRSGARLRARLHRLRRRAGRARRASAACRCSAVPAGGQPRASLGYLSMPLLATLEAAGSARTPPPTSTRPRRCCARATWRWGPRPPTRRTPPSASPGACTSKQAVVYGAGLTVPAARRWKGQINENAKAPAFWNELPELDHNELMGWTSLPHVAAATLAVFLDDAQGDARLLRRVRADGAPSWRREAWRWSASRRAGTSRLARLFSLVQLGDYASLLPRPSLRRRSHAGGGDRGVQGQARRRRRRLSACRAAVALVLTADEPAARRAAEELFPDADAPPSDAAGPAAGRALRGPAVRDPRPRGRRGAAWASWCRSSGAGTPPAGGSAALVKPAGSGSAVSRSPTT